MHIHDILAPTDYSNRAKHDGLLCDHLVSTLQYLRLVATPGCWGGDTKALEPGSWIYVSIHTCINGGALFTGEWGLNIPIYFSSLQGPPILQGGGRPGLVVLIDALAMDLQVLMDALGQLLQNILETNQQLGAIHPTQTW